ncbi:unnamed protein product [Gadus morhua 'NCC']
MANGPKPYWIQAQLRRSCTQTSCLPEPKHKQPMFNSPEKALFHSLTTSYPQYQTQGRSLGRGFRGGAPGPWGSGGARPRGPRLAPVGPPRGRGRPTVAVLAAV